ncbi:MAG: hypothetical protein M5U26_28705 [Planctomycetota bacterium]|nr:hypothetical protein [Planctomycetota bacterium]
MAQHYSELKQHLDEVRRGWKQTQALQGLAVVLVEGLGLFVVFSLLDYAYVWPQGMRVGALALLGGLLAFLFGRHVIRPLRREIPDRQVALYVEERHKALDGALLSATEFGSKNPDGASPIYSFIVQEIVREAALQARSFRLGEILDLSRLRKYAIAAALVLVVFGVSALRYQDFFGRQSRRILMPWEMTQEDRIEAGVYVSTEPPIRVELVTPAPGNRRILRGGSVDVKVRFSRAPEGEVALMFRGKGAIEFQRLQMDEVDELNTYALRLTDLNEETELMAKAGTAASDNVRIEVYDPLRLKGIELTATPPNYTRQKPMTQFGSSGDVTALVGTQVRLRAVGNAPLAGGKLVFDGGKEVELKPLTGEGEDGAVAIFPVEQDAGYTVYVRGADGQEYDLGQTFYVKALADEPPTLEVLAPGSDSSAHPLSEVTFSVRAQDDVGLGEVVLHYQHGDDEAGKVDVPFALANQPEPGGFEYAHVLALSELPKKVAAGDTLFYHLSVKDLKGQLYVSDIYYLKVSPLEVAGAFPASEPHPHPPEPLPLQLIKYIAVAWNIHVEKEKVGDDEHNQRCANLVQAMTYDDGTPRKFHKFKQSKMPPEKWALVAEAEEYIKQGIDVLKTNKPETSVARWRKAQALLEKVATGLDFLDKATAGGGGMAAQKDPMKEALGFLKMEIPTPDLAGVTVAADEPPLPDYQRKLPMEEAEKLREKAQELKREQQQILDEAEKLARNEKPQDERDPGAPKPEGAQAKPEGGQPKPQGEQQAKEGGQPKPQGEQQAKEGGQPKPQGEQQAKGESGERKPNEGARPEKQNDTDMASADREERRRALQDRQARLADQTRKLAEELIRKAPASDETAREVAEHIRNSAKEMDEALRNIGEQNDQRAAARGQKARDELDLAAEKLRLSSFNELDKALAAADDRARKVADDQHKINNATKDVVSEIEKRAGKPADDAPLKEREKQKLQGVAKLQVENQKKLEDLEDYLKGLHEWAEKAGKKETAEEIGKAMRTLRQDDVNRQMVTAAVNLGQQYLEDAKETQEKVEKSLNKVGQALRNAGDALATNKEDKLKNALKQANEIAKRADEGAKGKPLGEKNEGEGKPDGEKKLGEGEEIAQGKPDGEKKPGEGKETAQGKPDGEKKPGESEENAQGKPDGEKKPGEGEETAQGKPDGEKKPGEGKETAQGKPDGEKKPGEGKETAQGKPDGEKKPGEGKETAQGKPDGEKKPGEGQETAQGKPAGEKEPGASKQPSESTPRRSFSREEKEELAGQLRNMTSRLVERLERDRLVEAGLREELNRNKNLTGQLFEKEKKDELDRYLATLQAVQGRLEEKLESTLKAQRLSNAQREECPIVYRKMVNQYYETIAKE